MWHVTSVPPASYILQHRSRSCKCEVNYRHKLGIPSKTEVQGEAGHGSPGRLSETKGPQAELHAHFKGIIFSGNGEIGVCVWGWFPSQSSAGEGQPGEQRNQEDPTPARACHVGGAELPQPRTPPPHRASASQDPPGLAQEGFTFVTYQSNEPPHVLIFLNSELNW